MGKYLGRLFDNECKLISPLSHPDCVSSPAHIPGEFLSDLLKSFRNYMNNYWDVTRLLISASCKKTTTSSVLSGFCFTSRGVK